MQRLVKAGASLLLIGLLTVVLLEVLVRMMWPQQPPQLWLAPNERYGHQGKPNFEQRYPFVGTGHVMEVRTNSLGFRDEKPQPARDEVPTIVFAGDSFTFGHGVQEDERFDSVLCGKVAEAGIAIRCINTGVSAWGTLQETRYLMDHMDVLEPDIIVLTFCENDPHDDSYFLQHGLSFDKVTFPGKNFLRAHSHLFRLVQHLYLLSRKLRLFETVEAAEESEETPESPDAAAPQFAPPIPEELWQRTFGYLEDLRRGLLERNPEGRLILQATDPLDEDIRRHLSGFAADHEGVTYVDLHGAVAGLDLWDWRLSFDGHWTPAMHALSAEALYEALAPLLASED